MDFFGSGLTRGGLAGVTAPRSTRDLPRSPLSARGRGRGTSTQRSVAFAPTGLCHNILLPDFLLLFTAWCCAAAGVMPHLPAQVRLQHQRRMNATTPFKPVTSFVSTASGDTRLTPVTWKTAEFFHHSACWGFTQNIAHHIPAKMSPRVAGSAAVHGDIDRWIPHPRTLRVVRIRLLRRTPGTKGGVKDGGGRHTCLQTNLFVFCTPAGLKVSKEVLIV